MPTPVVIGLSAVVMGLRAGELCALTVRAPDQPLRALPFGSFDPDGARTFELALRAFVRAQTGFELGYVEQLYTFGDQGRDAPLADVGAGMARVVSVGYLALTPAAATADADWAELYAAFPWEDWRSGRPVLIDAAIGPALQPWGSRAAALFALDGRRWNEERVLERYELLYEAGLVAEAARDRGETLRPDALGAPMTSDHRRILATSLGRLRGKLKYRPVVFDLTPPTFTLSALQRTVEAIAGVRLHTQNFRRMIDRTGLVESTGGSVAGPVGRPAELFRASSEALTLRSGTGLGLPLAG